MLQDLYIRSFLNTHSSLSILEYENQRTLLRDKVENTVTHSYLLAHLFLYFKRATTFLLWYYLTQDAINWMKLRLTLEICHDNIPGSHTVFEVLPHPLFKVRDDPMKFARQILQIMDWDPKKWRNCSRFHGLWGPNCTSDMFFFNFISKCEGNKPILKLKTSHVLLLQIL